MSTQATYMLIAAAAMLAPVVISLWVSFKRPYNQIQLIVVLLMAAILAFETYLFGFGLGHQDIRFRGVFALFGFCMLFTALTVIQALMITWDIRRQNRETRR